MDNSTVIAWLWLQLSSCNVVLLLKGMHGILFELWRINKVSTILAQQPFLLLSVNIIFKANVLLSTQKTASNFTSIAFAAFLSVLEKFRVQHLARYLLCGSEIYWGNMRLKFDWLPVVERRIGSLCPIGQRVGDDVCVCGDIGRCWARTIVRCAHSSPRADDTPKVPENPWGIFLLRIQSYIVVEAISQQYKEVLAHDEGVFEKSHIRKLFPVHAVNFIGLV